MARDREEERKNVHEAVETLRIAWDELCVQFSDLTIEQRIAMFDVFIRMTTPITIPIEAEEEDEAEEQYGRVRRDGGGKRKRK